MNGNCDSKKTCVIVASGELGNATFLQQYLDGFVIFVDGGLNYVDALGVEPDLIIGDMDSFKGDLSAYRCKVIVHDTQKDDTDTGLAVKYALENGYNDIVLIAGTGGRLDHTFANIQIMAYAAEKGVDIKMVKDDTIIYVTNKSPIVFDRPKQKYVSVFAFSEKVTGVNLMGMKYPLVDAVLENTFPVGVSNECISAQCGIYFNSGTICVMFCEKL